MVDALFDRFSAISNGFTACVLFPTRLFLFTYNSPFEVNAHGICFFASLFAIELLFGHLQFIPVTVSYRPRYASFLYKVFIQHWIHRQRSVLVYTLYRRQPHFHLFFHSLKWPKCCDITLQTQSTGLRHPSLEEGAGKRCSEFEKLSCKCMLPPFERLSCKCMCRHSRG